MIGGLRQLCRLYYTVPMAAAYALTLYYARGGEMTGEWRGLLVTSAALAIVVAAAYVLNDVCDVAVDRRNAPGRPIPAGRVSRRMAAAWGTVLLAVGLGVGALARPSFAIGLAAVAAGLVVYNVFSKRIGAAKPVLVAALMTSMYPLAIAQAEGWRGPRAGSLGFFAAWMFLTAFGYEVLKDIRDARGDRVGSRSPSESPRRLAVWRKAAGGAVVLGALLLGPPVAFGCRWVYLAAVSPAVAAAVASVWQPTRKAIAFVYAECCLVGIAALADVVILGF